MSLIIGVKIHKLRIKYSKQKFDFNMIFFSNNFIKKKNIFKLKINIKISIFMNFIIKLLLLFAHSLSFKYFRLLKVLFLCILFILYNI